MLIAITHLGVSGALFVAAVVVGGGGLGWSVGRSKRVVPRKLGIDRMDDPISIARRPIGTSQADAVLAVSSAALTALLLAVPALIAD